MMIDQYLKSIKNTINRDINNNPSQKQAITAAPDENQYIIAGPGSGKTTVIILKILKYIFIDNIKPEEILVTTFTKKVAKELQEKTQKWGELIQKELKSSNIDFKNITIGTIDSIAEDILTTENKEEINIIDNFTSSAVMMQTITLKKQLNKNKKLKQYLKKIRQQQYGINTTEINNSLLEIKDRLYYDMVDKEKLKSDLTYGQENILEAIEEYNKQLDLHGTYDFTLLENKLLEYLKDDTKLKDIKILLIDEYQDSNLLQEQIYFQIAKRTFRNKGNITVVGDDDQSLYRFRGATINLFVDYSKRIEEQLQIIPKIIYLQKNYRSTKNIIEFANEFITLDEKYQESRTNDKPEITISENTRQGLPVLGLFRDDIEKLSIDLTTLITTLIKHESYLSNGHNISVAKKNPKIALLMNSPREITHFSKKRLPYYLREKLKQENIEVYNPRGQNIEQTHVVSVICGLIQEIIDPEEVIGKNLEDIPLKTTKTLKHWRKIAKEYNKIEKLSIQIKDPNNINIKTLLNEIIGKTSKLQETIENRIFIEIIEQTVEQTIKYLSIESDGITPEIIFWNILIPIATGAIDVDDSLFKPDLKNILNVMSIHQAKGLEFDVVIVDVGSDIENNNSSNAFKRFPKSGGKSYQLESELRKYSPIPFDDTFNSVDLAFNDLIRRYFVAYTRAKSILILVGLNSMRFGYKGDFQDNVKIYNVATGYSRDKLCHWPKLYNIEQL
ncbi:MAG: DEAD/DEAH box helicase [Methanobacteriaceae archaeon]|nr:DEAD/DEAH box helicase [Methanobacteriaceae archaeon]